MSGYKKKIAVILTVIIITGTVFPSIALGAASDPTDLDETFEVSDGGQIHGWERAAYPLRTNDTDAATQVDPPGSVDGEELAGNTFTSDDDGSNSKTLIRNFLVQGNTEENPLGVHTQDETVEIVFDSALGTSDGSVPDALKNEDVEFIAARINTSDSNSGPVTDSEAFDILSSVENANENASFEVLLDDSDSGSAIGSDGIKSVQETFETPGQYVIYAAVHESGKNGFETGTGDNADDEISVDGDVTIIGADGLTVQRAGSTVTAPSSPQAGEALDFTVDASNAISSSGSVTHAVAVYDKSTFASADFDLVVDADKLGTNFNQSTDSQLEHTIETLNGVAKVESGTTLNGADLADGEVAAPTSASAAIDFFAGNVGANDPNTDAIGTQEIDASVRAVNGENPERTLTVPTFSNFSSGEYQYVVYSALDNNDSEVATNAGTITINQGGPVSSVSTETLDFGTLTTGSTTTSTVTLENTGTAPLDVTDISISGTDSGEFSVVSGGNTGTVAAGGTQQIGVEFAPSTAETLNADLDITTNASDQTVNLEGEGTNPAGADIAVSSSDLSFNNVDVSSDGSTTATKSVDINSVGDVPLRLSDISIFGSDRDQFSITNGGSEGVVEDGNSRTVDVEFAPTRSGDQTATLVIESNDSERQEIEVSLSGTGASADVEVVSARPVVFKAQSGSSSSQAIEVINPGTKDVDLSVAGFTDTPFSVDSTLPTVSAGTTTPETFTVKYSPTGGIGIDRTTLKLQDSSGNTLQQLRIFGEARGSRIAVRPAGNIDFGETIVDNTTTRGFVIGSTGTADLTVDDISISGTNSGAFDVVGSTSYTISPGERRFVRLEANPTSAGNKEATVTVSTSSSSTSDPTRTLKTSAKDVDLNLPSSSADFSNVPVGSSTSQTITVENNAGSSDGTTLTVNATSISSNSNGAFSLVTTDQLSISPGGNKEIAVAYKPGSASTSDSATLNLESNDPNSPNPTVSLSGSADSADMSITDSAPVTFGPIASGDTETKTLTIRNDNANSDLTNFGVTSGPTDFSVDGLPSSLAPGETDTFTVEFEGPSSTGSYRHGLTIEADIGGGSTTATASTVLSGTVEGASAQIRGGARRFGVVNTDDASSTESIRVKNVGPEGTTLSISSTSISSNPGPGGGSSEYSVSTPSSISGGESGTVDVTFDPTSNGPQIATLDITAAGETTPVTLIGIGTGPQSVVSQSSVDFGAVTIDDTVNQSVTVRNDGGVPMDVTDVSISGSNQDDFSLENDPGSFTLVPGQTQQLTVSATPSTDSLLDDASLDIDTNESSAGNDASVDLEVNGIAPTVDPDISDGSTLSFSDTPTSSASTKTITVDNTGNALLTLGAPEIQGADSQAFAVGKNTPTRLSPDESETFTVVFSPTDDVTFSDAQFVIPSINDPDNTELSYDLDGTGTTSDASLSQGSINFGQVPVDSTESTTISLSNTGGAGSTLDADSVSIKGADASAFSVSGLQGESISSGGSESFTISTTPTVSGASSARVVIDDSSSAGNDATVALTTTGTEPGINADASVSSPFDSTRLGGGNTGTISIENTGNVPLEVGPSAGNRLSLSGNADQFTLEQDTLVIPAKSTRSVDVTYEPQTDSTTVAEAQAGNTHSATLNIPNNATSTQTTSLTGTPITPDLSTGTSNLQYGTVNVDSEVTQTVDISNTVSGTTDFTITDTSISGPDSGAYEVSNSDNVEDTTLDAGNSQTVEVKFNPQSTGAKYASLTVTTDDPRESSTTVFLSNTDTVVDVTFGSADVQYNNPTSGAQPEVNITRGLDTDAEVRQYELATEGQPSGNFNSKLQFGDTPVGNNDPTLSNANAFRYIDATENTGTAGNFKNATFTFGVEKAALAEAGEDPDGVTLYHEDGSSYESLTTNRIGETKTQWLYNATATEFSAFAIGGVQETSDGPTNPGGGGGGDDDETPTPTPTPTPTEAPAGGGGQVGDDTGVDAPTPEPVQVNVTQTNDTTTATVESVTANQTIVTNIQQTDADNESGASVNQLNVTSPSDASNVKISIRQSDRPTEEDVPANDRARTTLRYVEVDVENVSDPDRSPGSFTFTVSEQRREELGVEPENILMYRYNGSWDGIETTYLGGDQFRADTPGFSQFAIGVAEPSINVTDVSLNLSTVPPGQSVGVSAVVNNTGEAEGSIPLELTVDGETIDSRNVTVGPETSTTEAFTVTLSETGDYDISVNGVAASTTLTVSESATVTAPGTDTPGQDGDGSPLVIIGLLIVILLIGGTVYLYYQQEEGEE